MQLLQEKEIPKSLNEKLKTSSLTQSEAFIPIFALSEILSGIQTKRQCVFFLPLVQLCLRSLLAWCGVPAFRSTMWEAKEKGSPWVQDRPGLVRPCFQNKKTLKWCCITYY